MTKSKYPSPFKPNEKIDWDKPIEIMVNGSWAPCDLLATLLTKDKARRIIRYNVHGDETLTRVPDDSFVIRNRPSKTVRAYVNLYVHDLENMYLFKSKEDAKSSAAIDNVGRLLKTVEIALKEDDLDFLGIESWEGSRWSTT